MGMTLIEKIIAHNIGREKVSPGEIVTVNVDRVMVHDIFIPFVAEKFEEMGFSKIWDPDRMVLIYDHLVPASQLDDARHFAKGDAFAAKYGVKHVHRSDGICHQLMTEAGYVLPGDIAFGTDSHTVTYGCVGAFSTGIGYTEMAGILGTGKLWIRVLDQQKSVVDGVAEKDARIGAGNDTADAESLDDFGSLLTGGAAAEVFACYNDVACMDLLSKLRAERGEGIGTHIVDGLKSQIFRRHDDIGIDIVAQDPDLACKLFHRLIPFR